MNPATTLFCFALDEIENKAKKQPKWFTTIKSVVAKDDGKFESQEIRDVFVSVCGIVWLGFNTSLYHHPDAIAELFLKCNQTLSNSVSSSDGTPALEKALYSKRWQLARKLIKAGADVQKCSSVALNSAILGKQGDLVTKLLDGGAKIGDKALKYALKEHCDAMVHQLLDANAPISDLVWRVSKTPTMHALFEKVKADRNVNATITALEQIEKKYNNREHEAFFEDAKKAVAKNDGKFDSADVRQVFIAACGGGLDDVVDLFLERNKNLSTCSLENMPYYHPTPLTAAVENGHVSTVSKLIAAGADVNAVNRFGQTALVVAIKSHVCFTELVEILIAANTDVDKKDNYGLSALYYATCKHSDVCVKLLLNANAKVTKDVQMISKAPLVDAVFREKKPNTCFPDTPVAPETPAVTVAPDTLVASATLSKKDKIDPMPEKHNLVVEPHECDNTVFVFRKTLVAIGPTAEIALDRAKHDLAL